MASQAEAAEPLDTTSSGVGASSQGGPEQGKGKGKTQGPTFNKAKKKWID